MHHLVARHIRAVSVVIDEFDNFPHAADYTLLKSGSESKAEKENTAGERRPRDQKIRKTTWKTYQSYFHQCVKGV